jgi:signal-transduction protein with cAMP-binding, CBS, and nucleotidyltransferase domain
VKIGDMTLIVNYCYQIYLDATLIAGNAALVGDFRQGVQLRFAGNQRLGEFA